MSNLAERLLLIVATLRAALGAYGRRLASPPQQVWLGLTLYTPIPTPEPLPRLAPELWTLFWNRLGRPARRVQALYDQWRAGTLKPMRVRPARERAARPVTAPPRLPSAFAWVPRRAPECGPAAGMLEFLLQDEETHRFVQQVPLAARQLRPLCRALGVQQPAWLKLPPRPRKPRPPRPPRPDRPLALTDPRLNLPRNIILAARAWKKRDGEA